MIFVPRPSSSGGLKMKFSRRRRAYPLAGTPASHGIPSPKRSFAPVTLRMDQPSPDPPGHLEALIERAEKNIARSMAEVIYAPRWRWETTSFPARPGAPEPSPITGLAAALDCGDLVQRRLGVPLSAFANNRETFA